MDIDSSPTTQWAAEEDNCADAPRVVSWYRIYCALMTLISLVSAFGGLLAFQVVPRARKLGIEPDDVRTYSAVLLIGGLLLAILFAAGLVVPPGRKAWFFGFVPIAVGLVLASLFVVSHRLNPGFPERATPLSIIIIVMSYIGVPVTVLLLACWAQSPTRDFFYALEADSDLEQDWL